MSATWAVVIIVGVATVAIKALGPVLLGGRPLPARARRRRGAPGARAAGGADGDQHVRDGQELGLDARALGVGAAAIAIWRRAPVLLVVVIAAMVTARRPAPIGALIGSAAMMRYRDLGFTVGQLQPGPLNAITDVDGVKVGWSR